MKSKRKKIFLVSIFINVCVLLLFVIYSALFNYLICLIKKKLFISRVQVSFCFINIPLQMHVDFPISIIANGKHATSKITLTNSVPQYLLTLGPTRINSNTTTGGQ